MRTRLTIDNATRYPTRDLRRLALWCIRHEGAENRTCRLVIRYARGCRSSGRASYNGPWIKLCLPRRQYAAPPRDDHRLEWVVGMCDGEQAARVLIHEIGHNLGLDHRDMVNWWEIPLDGFPDDLRRLHELQPALKPKPSREQARQAKLDHARTKIAEWETKAKRASTALKKWRHKARYHERELAKLTAASPQVNDTE